ncbi:FKBP-type peptidyl-prolyl cis-trans isomerase [Cellulomonas sp. NPDC089187]|uniref:FKBP-type peptidyl-prolyl cis-trans isomerase n=1 Tax=Cellulomonas sp. NPDC089187 TaxID=3154970 RepID=UPI003424F6EC
MRRTAAVIIAATLLLAGCSGGGEDPAPSASASSSASAASGSLDDVTVTGEPGEEPQITAEWPFELSKEAAKVVDAGDGEQIADGQLISIHLRAVSGIDGEDQGGSYAGAPQSYWLSDQATTGLPAVLSDTLIGQQVGARVLYAGPGTAASGDDATLIWVVDVTAAQNVLDAPSGEAVTPQDGLPTVTLADDGEPSITPVDGEAPTDLIVQPLIEGTGPEVTATGTVVANYSGWLWDGTAFDSSWSRGAPTAFGLNQVIAGWTQGLAGQKVGSQMLLVIPPELGYGDEDTSSIPGGSTLIFVVDILAGS